MENLDAQEVYLLFERERNVYRYKFAEEVSEALYRFAKVHQYDERDDFKDAWKKWSEDQVELLDQETRRLRNLGYTGNVEEKMFKSARYYFRKKSTATKEPVQRRMYVSCPKTVLQHMDDHIRDGLDRGNFKPSDGFEDFCTQHMAPLQEEIEILHRQGFTDPKSKIKKTYKNRYYLLANK